MKKTFLLLLLTVFLLFSCKQKEKTSQSTEIKTDHSPKSISKNIEMNLNSNNYEGSDITMQLYKDIIEYYGCGDHSVNGKVLGKQNEIKIFIVENDCGDFPFKHLISVENGKIIDKITIEENSFDVEKSETQNIQDETDTTFDIRDLFNIEIKTTHSINGEKINTTTKIYRLDEKGKFQQIK